MATDSTQKQIDELVKRMDAAEAQIRRLRFGVEPPPEAVEKAGRGICLFCDKPAPDFRLGRATDPQKTGRFLSRWPVKAAVT